ncbi:MAG: peptide deformylase, partial [Sulfurimonas sp.]
DVQRYEKITIVYEDSDENQHFRDVEGELAASFQQQMDYCSGSTFVDRVDKELKEKIDAHLEFGLVEEGGSCPTVFYRDYFKKAAKIVMVLLFASGGSYFFSNSIREAIFNIDKLLLVLVPLLLVAYFFYALYESRRYKQCTSCQIGNIIGGVAIYSFWFVLVGLEVFWLVKV